MPVWISPKNSPGPRSFRSYSASWSPFFAFSIDFRRSAVERDVDSVKRRQYDLCSPRPTRPRNW